MKQLKRFWFVGVFLLVCLSVAAFNRSSFGENNRTASADISSAEQIQKGRFRIILVTHGGNESSHAYLLDSETGRCWRRGAAEKKFVSVTPDDLEKQATK